MASIFYTYSYGLLNFVVKDNKRLDRCTKVVLLDYESLGGVKLDKIDKKEVTDRHKAKQEIHFLYKQNFLKLIDNEVFMSMEMYLRQLIDRFNLSKWFENKIEFWEKKYKNMNYNQDIVFEMILRNCDFFKQFLKTKSEIKIALSEVFLSDAVGLYRTAKEQGFTATYRSFYKLYEKTLANDFDLIFEL